MALLGQSVTLVCSGVGVQAWAATLPKAPSQVFSCFVPFGSHRTELGAVRTIHPLLPATSQDIDPTANSSREVLGQATWGPTRFPLPSLSALYP